MAGTQPGKPGGSWQVTGSPRTGPGSVALVSGGAFFLSDGAAFPFSPTVRGCVPQNADIFPQFPALTLHPLIVYSFGLFGGDSKDLYNPAIKLVT